MDKHIVRYGLLLAALIFLLSVPLVAVIAQDSTEEPVATEEPAAVAEAETGETQPDTGFIAIVRYTHSIVRWIVVVITVIAIIKLIAGVVQGSAFDALAQRLMLAFSMGVTLQWVVGLILLVSLGSVTGFGFRHFWEHAGIMTVAVALAHMHNRWKNAPDSTRYRASLAIVVIVLVLVFVGVGLLPQGWRVLPA
ncbi:MAG: hypothetical protein H6671_07180 [Anaerolineaceae bacterium]|nr:hypothetical protein [Anaerolineaceae bacterium]